MSLDSKHTWKEYECLYGFWYITKTTPKFSGLEQPQSYFILELLEVNWAQLGSSAPYAVAGAAHLQTGPESKTAHSQVARSVVRGCWLEHLGSPPPGLSMLLEFLTGLQEVSLQSITATTFYCQNMSGTTQFKGKKKRLCLFLSHDTIWTHHICGELDKPKVFIIGALIPLLFIKKLPFVDSIQPRSRETGLLLLDLLLGKNRVRMSPLDWILTSREPRSPWGYLKDQELYGLENSGGL